MRGHDLSRFVPRGTSLEPAATDLGVEITPLDDFFVCKVGEPVEIAVESWNLVVEGDAIENRSVFGITDLQDLPQHRVDAWLECAGNGRSLFGLAGGKPVSPAANDTPWMLGAMGMATWRGPSLGTVIDIAGLAEEAAWVSPAALDHPNSEGEPVRMCLPLDKAMHQDTIVALEMNGSPLEPMHGFPARLLVPGWVGAYSVKWLDRIEVSNRWISSWRADTYYRLRTPDGDDLGPATAHPVKSSLALPWPAALSVGPVEIHGYARVAGATIARVEWRIDDGPWRDAELFGPNDGWTWSPFRIEWDAMPGDHVVRTRATDANGNTQPNEMRFHPDGILWNAVIPHPVSVR